MSQEIHKSQLLLEETSKEEEGSDEDGNLCQICFDQKIQIAIDTEHNRDLWFYSLVCGK